MDDHQFKQLLAYFNLSGKGYRKVRKGVKKRIARHMQSLGCRQIERYLQRLAADETIKNQCAALMTVSISRFYRDRRVWSVLEKELLPDLVAGRTAPVRIWSAGCGRGEEVYSFRIAWEDLRLQRNGRPRLEIVATDVNSDYLAQAQKGVYNRGSVRELTAEQLGRYFESRPGGSRYCIRPELKTNIAWSCQDLVSGQNPPGLFDIIFLRNNLLTYYRDPQKGAAFERVTATLQHNGTLIIGAHERLPDTAGRFVPVSGTNLIFQYR